MSRFGTERALENFWRSTESVLRLLAPCLQLHAQPICDAIDVGVVCGDGRDIEDVAVSESDRVEAMHIRSVHGPGCACESLDVLEHRQAPVAQSGCSPVSLDRIEKFVISEEAPQTATVMRESVVASVDVADNQGDQFAFNLA